MLHDAASGRWLRFTRPCRVVAAGSLDQVAGALAEVQRAAASGMYAAGFLSYEAAPAFDSALVTRAPDDFPLLWFTIFRSAEPMSLPAPGKGLAALSWTPSVSRAAYDAAILRIKDHIAAGDTYQVNYTFRLRSRFTSVPWELFLHLARARQAPYAAYMDTGRFVLCSASPELFFTLSGNRLVSVPMKGTAPRGRTLEEDSLQARNLRRCPKNRAENVMIADMVRNDISRVAETGTVRVPRLFAVTRYPTLWQMTTTVEAQTSHPASEIMAALFPCASITGAPKYETARIIARLEDSCRRVYTGCMGFFRPGGDCQFNVAIRTAIVDRERAEAEYGVGGGIVWDSTAPSEYDECAVKARVLTNARQEFSLLETLLWTKEDGFFLLDQHIRRLKSSAAYFGRRVKKSAVIAALEQKAACFRGPAFRVRLLVSERGEIRLEDTPLSGQPQGPVRLALAREPLDSSHVFLFHKTTLRGVYENARQAAPQADDVILYNEKRQITETTTANLVFEKNGKRYTPPVCCGLLAGTYRAHLLEKGQIEEKVIPLESVKKWDAIYCINSVRKQRKAVLAEI